MPTIMSSIKPSTAPSGPKIVLSSTPATSPAQPMPVPQMVTPEPTQQPSLGPQSLPQSAPQSPPQPTPPVAQTQPKPAPISEPVISHQGKNADAMTDVTKTEADLIKQLEAKQSEEAGLLEKIKQLLSKKVATTKDTPAKVKLTPATLSQPTPPISQPIPQATSEPTPEPTSKASGQPVALISPVQHVLNALQTNFGSDATIAAMLTADALVERSPDKNGVLITGPHGQIHFSTDDLKQAKISVLDLSDIPYGATQTATASAVPTLPPVETAPVVMTEPMKKLVAVLTKNPPANAVDILGSVQTVYRSPDLNGVLLVSGSTVVRISDAELIQSNVTAGDIVDLPAGDISMMP